MKIVAFFTLAHVLLTSPCVEGRRHNFRGVATDRDLKSKKSGGSGGTASEGTNRVVGSGGGGGTGGSATGSKAKKSERSNLVGNRAAPECMMKTPPDCVTWPLDEAAANR